MDKFLINGGNRLKGTVSVSGSKNAALPMLMSSLLVKGEITYSNIPTSEDIKTALSLLSNLGVSVKFTRNVVKINSSGLNNYKVSYKLGKKMRGTILALAPLVARIGRAIVPLPGGCSIGARPIDLHLRALEKLGIRTKTVNGCIEAVCNRLKGANIYFEIPTVTGTENLIMASVLADGITILNNVACDPEIVALSQSLNDMGAKIVGAGTSKICITGIKKLHPASHFVIPDRIEVCTFMIASALTNGDIYIPNCMPQNLKSVIEKLCLIGAEITVFNNDIRIIGNKKISCLNFYTAPYPGFPTDVQPLFVSLLSLSSGISIVSETIFENRLGYAKELNKMGADIHVEGNVAVIKGVKSLYGNNVVGNDLRGCVSLVLAALGAYGETKVSGIKHLDRGYENIEKKIKLLGGNIRRY